MRSQSAWLEEWEERVRTPKSACKSIINSKAQQCWALNYSGGERGICTLSQKPSYFVSERTLKTRLTELLTAISVFITANAIL